MNIKNKNKNRAIRIAVLVLLAAALLLFPRFLNGYYKTIIINIVMYAYFACCWNIIGGFAGQFSLGHALYIGIGAYTSTILYNTWGISPWIGMFAGGILAAIVGVAIGFPCFKLKSTYFTLTSVAICTIAMLLVQNTQTIGGVNLGGAIGLQIKAESGDSFWNFQFRDKMYYFYIILAMLVVILLVCLWIKKSKMGYQLAAIANNQEAAEALSVNSRALKLKAMAISSFFCALGGTFYAQFVLVCSPTTLFGHGLSDELAIISLIGGKGTIIGPAFGAVLVKSISEVTSGLFGNSVVGMHLAIYGIMLIVCIRFFPDGLLPIFQKLFAKLKNKLQNKKETANNEEEV